MGVNSSKNSEIQFQEIASAFSEEEINVLLQDFNDFIPDDLNQKQPKPEGVSTPNVKNHLPTILDEDLKDGFVSYFQIQSAITFPGKKKEIPTEKLEKLIRVSSSSMLITKIGFFSAIKNLIKSLPDEQSQAVYVVGKLNQNKLRDFIQQVTKAAIFYWFEGSFKRDKKKNTKGNVKKDESDNLVDYLIISPKLKSQESEEENTEILCNLIKESDMEGYFNEGLFTDWYISNAQFQHLFNILVNRLFLQKNLNHELTDFLNAQRTNNNISPEIASPYKLPKFSNLLKPSDYYILNHHLPIDCRTQKHTLLFSSRLNGDSWFTFVNSLLYKGSTLIIIKDKDDYVFGGFAYDDWVQNPKFYGLKKNFLFTIKPKLRCYTASNYNDNFQYLNFGTKTLPNGLGMGGQFDYCGLWINETFTNGHSKAEPLSSTYVNPQLSKKQEFEIEEVEVWQVKPTERDLDEIPTRSKLSVLDKSPAELELLEMATNKKFYSKEVREPNVLYFDDDDDDNDTGR